MSTKTLRKRIALVAVSALGAGLLSVVAVPSANAAHTAGTFDANNTNSTSTVVASFTTYCADTSVVGTVDAITIPVGATFTTTVAVGAAGSTTAATAKKAGVITGGAIGYRSFTGGTADTTGTGAVAASTTVSAGGRLTLRGATPGTGTVAGDAAAAVFTFGAIAAGSAAIVYAAGTDADIVSSSTNTLYITVVAACSSSTYSAADSYVYVKGVTATTAATTTNVDAVLSATSGASLYINVTGNNAYAAPLTTGTYAASATNGALVSWSNDAIVAPSKGTVSVATVTPDGTDMLRINPASAVTTSTTTVTITHNGAPVATKTLTFFGEAASIEVVKTSVGKTSTPTAAANSTTGFFLYQYKDSAGNVVPGSAASLDATTATATIPSLTGDKAPTAAAAASAGVLADAIETGLGAVTYGVMAYDCGATAGSSTVTIKHTNAISAADITKTVPLSCFGGIDTYTVSTDKASYQIGEIATITITAKDSKGNPVADSTVMAADTVSVGGGSLTKAVATTDAFTGGVRTYKAQMTAAGTFNTVVSLTGTTTTSATASYKVAGGDVAMADVLKAIVSLIASINKQIAALQKALLKK